MKRALMGACLAVVAAATESSAETIAGWTFESLPAGLVTTGSAFGAPAEIGSGDMFGVHASSSTSWFGSGGNGSSRSLGANTWFPGDYVQFDFSTVGYADIQLSWDQMKPVSDPGTATFTVSWSTDGVNYFYHDDYTAPGVNWNNVTTAPLSRFEYDLSALSVLEDQPTASIRLTYVPIGGPVFPFSTLRFDNFTVDGASLDGGGTFDQVLTLPPDPDIEDYATIAPNTQVNVRGGDYNFETGQYENGSIGWAVTAGDGELPANIEINVFGREPDEDYSGEVSQYLSMFDGVTLNVLGGKVYGNVSAYSGAEVSIENGDLLETTFLHAGAEASISGGTVGGSDYGYYLENRMATHLPGGLQAESGSAMLLEGGVLAGDYSFALGSELEVRGGEFLLNGTAIPGLGGIGTATTISLTPGDVVTGVLHDGTPMALAGTDVQASLKLTVASVPAAGPDSIVVDDWFDQMPRGVRSGQTLSVNFLDLFHEEPLAVGPGGTAELQAGRFLDPVVAQSGSLVQLSGSAYVEELFVETASELMMNGGAVHGMFLDSGSSVTVSGGDVESINASAGGSLTLRGGSFKVNGTPVTGLSQLGDQVAIDLDPGDVLTGELSDGRPTMLYGGAALADGVLKLSQQAPAPITETTVNVSTVVNAQSQFAREGQTYNVLPGGRLGSNFDLGYGSQINFLGGDSTDYWFEAFGGSEVNIYSGAVDGALTLHAQSSLLVEGGTVNYFALEPGATGEVAGGTVSSAAVYGVLEVNGGSIGASYVYGDLQMAGGSIASVYSYAGEVALSGGALERFQGEWESVLTLVGSEFSVGGVDVTAQLSTTTPYVVSTRNMQLEGTLADGTELSEFIAGTYAATGWYSIAGGTTIQLLLADAATTSGDYDGDGTVDGTDFLAWQRGHSPNGLGSGDLETWRNHFGAGATAAANVPEPSAAALAAALAAAFAVLALMVRARQW